MGEPEASETPTVDGPARSTAPRPTRVRDVVTAYLQLTKPRVIELLLVAAIPAIFQAHRGLSNFDLGLALAILFGGWLGAASANTFNMVVDYDIDQVMKRTERRPLAAHTVTRQAAFIFAVLLGVCSVLWLWLVAHSMLAGFFIVVTIAFYIVVYTIILKRRTSQNIVWGGLAGCMPVMVAWAGVTDNLPPGEDPQWWQAIVLFLVIFFWTPPHTWALSMKYKEDYRRAGVPMLPVVKPEDEVARQIVIYTWFTVLTTLVLIPAAGFVYALGAVMAGVWFLIAAHRLYRGVKNGISVKPMGLFFLTNNYLSVVSVALSIDALMNLTTIGSLLS